MIGAESLPSGAVVRPFSVLYRLKSIEKRFVGEEIEIKFSRVGIALSGPFDLFAAMCMFGACLGNVLDYARGIRASRAVMVRSCTRQAAARRREWHQSSYALFCGFLSGICTGELSCVDCRANGSNARGRLERRGQRCDARRLSATSPFRHVRQCTLSDSYSPH